jgi:glucose-1-phosphate thymidylyltransferase
VDATAARRLRPHSATESSHYETPIGNIPLIGHVCAELAACRIESVRIVSRPDVRREIARIVGDGTVWGFEVEYAECGDPSASRTVLQELRRALGRGATLLHPGDGLLRRQLCSMVDRYTAGDVDAVLPEQASPQHPPPLRDRRVSSSALTLGPSTQSLVEGLLGQGDHEEDLVAALLSSDCRLAVIAHNDAWSYSDSTEDLLAANRMVLDWLDGGDNGKADENGNRIHGRVVISPAASVSNCQIFGPVHIADRAIVEDSFVGPYTAIASDAVVSGTEIDNSMVLAGAEVRHPGSRIEASIIGEGARVVRSFDLPRGLHLRLGPGSNLTLS